jgi:hypothetical protein
MGLFHLVQDKFPKRFRVFTEMNFLISWKMMKSLTTWATVSFSTKTLLLTTDDYAPHRTGWFIGKVQDLNSRGWQFESRPERRPTWLSSVFSGKWRVSTSIWPFFQNPQSSHHLTAQFNIPHYPPPPPRFIIWGSGDMDMQQSTQVVTFLTCTREVTSLNPVGAPIILTDFLRGFPQFLQATAG